MNNSSPLVVTKQEDATTFRSLVGGFAYQSPEPRRSPRKHTPGRFRFISNDEEHDDDTPPELLPKPARARQKNLKSEEDKEGYYLPEPPASTSAGDSKRRKRTKREEEDDSERDEKPRKRKRKPARKYAAPETYAHLDPLSDHLADDLDVIFCGINPGQDSARFGFHYAHRTNHFWPCLHRGGFTDKLLPPSDGPILPEKHNIGLTNLIERPSAEAGELSKEEMTAAAPALLAKIRGRRPRAVCFVGKVIWEAIVRVLRQHAPPAVPSPISSSSPSPSPSHFPTKGSPSPSKRKSPAKRSAKATFTWGLQPYKLTHAMGATLLYVVPSTSARVTSHQLGDKAELFSALKVLVDEVKEGTFDTGPIVAVDLPPDELDEAGEAKNEVGVEVENRGRTERDGGEEREARDEVEVKDEVKVEDEAKVKDEVEIKDEVEAKDEVKVKMEEDVEVKSEGDGMPEASEMEHDADANVVL